MDVSELSRDSFTRTNDIDADVKSRGPGAPVLALNS
jgi:hypothetical protein